jgi:hypothetical protein
MVGDNCDESVKIGEDLRQKKILDGVHVHIIPAKGLLQKEKGHRQHKKVKEKIRPHNNHEELRQRVKGNGGGNKCLDCDGIRGDDTLWDFATLTT